MQMIALPDGSDLVHMAAKLDPVRDLQGLSKFPEIGLVESLAIEVEHPGPRSPGVSREDLQEEILPLVVGREASHASEMHVNPSRPGNHVPVVEVDRIAEDATVRE